MTNNLQQARVLSLRLWLPILITGFFLILWLGTAIKSKWDIETNLIQSNMNFVIQDLSTLQQSINRALRGHHPRNAWQSLSSRGVTTQYTTLVAIDDTGIILHATRLELIGHNINTAYADFDPARFKNLQNNNRIDIMHNRAKHNISAYLPIILEQLSHEIRPVRIGAIIASFDLSRQQKIIWSQVLQSSLVVGLFMLVIMSLLLWFLTLFITKPIQFLVNKANAIAQDKPDIQHNIIGSGELLKLSTAFEHMEKQLEKRFNERLQAENISIEFEKKFRALYAHSPDMNLSILPDDGTVILCNETLILRTGYSRDEIIGSPVIKLYHADCHNIIKKSLKQFSETGEVHNVELILLCKDGSKIDVSLNADAVRDNAGKILYSMSSLRDITRLKVTEKALRQSQKMEAVGQLTGGIAHDFNNILNIILGNLELLKLNLPYDEKNNKRIEVIQSSALRAAELTKKLLSFSRIKTEQLSVININHLIKNINNLIIRSVTPQIEIVHQLLPELWSTKINTGDFEDALLNILLNARDAMQGHGLLSIKTSNITLDNHYCTLKPSASPGDYTVLIISDNGIGMTSEQLEHIFEPFYTTKEQGKGTGLGLSMVYGFIERSGGHIEVSSTKNEGTIFRLYFPRSFDENPSVKKDNKDQAIALPRGTETLLVVDDENSLLSLAQETLQSLGYKVLIASNGQEALQHLNNKADIALLFTDVVMPGGINGYELVEKALTIQPTIKIMLTSGHNDKSVTAEQQARFHDKLISKPYSLSGMTQLLRKMLDNT